MDPDAASSYTSVPKNLVNALDRILDKNIVELNSENAQSRFTALQKAVQNPELMEDDTETQDMSLTYIKKVATQAPTMTDTSFSSAMTPIGSIITAKKATDNDSLEFIQNIDETIRTVSKSVLNGAIPSQGQSNAKISENLKVSIERLSGAATSGSFMAFDGIT